MADARLTIDDIASVTARVHQAAIDVLGPVVVPAGVHQAKFSMGTTLGLIAAHGRAGMVEFDRDFARADVASFRDRVTMVLDEEVNAAYPARWIGKVEVATTDGRRVEARVDEPKGDPGNTLSRDEIDAKVRGLADFSSAATPSEMDAVLDRLWAIDRANALGPLMPVHAGD
jgi:2-methylcitrate dehydratase PrpD